MIDVKASKDIGWETIYMSNRILLEIFFQKLSGLHRFDNMAVIH